MRSLTKMRENKSESAAIVAMIAHNAAAYQFKHFKDSVPLLNQKMGYKPTEWSRHWKNGANSKVTRNR